MNGAGHHLVPPRGQTNVSSGTSLVEGKYMGGQGAGKGIKHIYSMGPKEERAEGETVSGSR